MFIGGGVSSIAGVTGGEGNFVMDGGTVSIGDPRQVSGSSLYIGWSPGTADSKGSFTLNNGTVSVNLPNSAIVVGSFQNNAGPLPTGQSGTLTVTGGQLLNPLGPLEIGQSGANGTFNLSGGLVSVNTVQWLNPAGNTNSRQFNWTGGTLEANQAVVDYPITNAGGTFRPHGANTGVFTPVRRRRFLHPDLR
jgi:hypothetical protein